MILYCIITYLILLGFIVEVADYIREQKRKTK